VVSEKLRAIANGSYRDKSTQHIRGNGYVVDCLEAALWCFWTTDSFRQAVLTAANLGDDADTTAAVCGQLAGAYYGAADIPPNWLERLSLREEISFLAGKLATH
jgi:ADP-ribosyl-[dinitrogen reductase] hydrolase